MVAAGVAAPRCNGRPSGWARHPPCGAFPLHRDCGTRGRTCRLNEGTFHLFSNVICSCMPWRWVPGAGRPVPGIKPFVCRNSLRVSTAWPHRPRLNCPRGGFDGNCCCWRSAVSSSQPLAATGVRQVGLDTHPAERSRCTEAAAHRNECAAHARASSNVQTWFVHASHGDGRRASAAQCRA